MGWSRYTEFPVYLLSLLLTLLHYNLYKVLSWSSESWSHTVSCLGPRMSWYWSSCDFWRNSLLWCRPLRSHYFTVPTLVCSYSCCYYSRSVKRVSRWYCFLQWGKWNYPLLIVFPCIMNPYIVFSKSITNMLISGYLSKVSISSTFCDVDT